MAPFRFSSNQRYMEPQEEPHPAKNETPLEPRRSMEALRLVEAYANDLRALIQKLARRLLH